MIKCPTNMLFTKEQIEYIKEAERLCRMDGGCYIYFGRMEKTEVHDCLHVIKQIATVTNDGDWYELTSK